MNHNFTDTQTDKATGTKYKKCQSCHKVMFINGDDYFNLNCGVRVMEKEDLRSRLENGL